MKHLFFALAVLTLLPATSLAASDYLLKLDGVDGEAKPTRATVEPIKATVVEPAATVAPPTGGTESATGYIKMEGVEGEAKVEAGKPMPGIEPDEIDYDGDSENATNFGILLGGSDTSDERKKGLERAAEVIRAHAAETSLPMESISLNFTKIEYKLKPEAKLFGFIPMKMLATVEIDETETATVTLPWWSIFATGVEREEIGMTAKKTLLDILKTQRDAVRNAIKVGGE